jgi:hypothetical protein
MGLFHHESLSEKEVKILQDVEKEIIALENEDNSELQSLMTNVKDLENLKKTANEVSRYIQMVNSGVDFNLVRNMLPQIDQKIATIERVVARLKIEGFQEEKKKFSLLETLSNLVADAKKVTKQYEKTANVTNQ